MTIASQKYRNIEFLFLTFLGLIILVIFASILYIGITVSGLFQSPSDIQASSEWAMVVLIGLLLALFYFGIFSFWQYRLWLGWLYRSKRKYLQLALVFVLSILPGLNGITDFTLRNVFGIEEPFTETLSKAFIYILLFPISGGN